MSAEAGGEGAAGTAGMAGTAGPAGPGGAEGTGRAAIPVPVSAGELVDKITILEIKAERIGDEAKRANVARELALLRAARAEHLAETEALDRLTAELAAINAALWEIEDAIRACEARGDFGDAFVALARSVYRTNDRRAAVKRAINEATGSALVEEKSYAPYAPSAPERG